MMNGFRPLFFCVIVARVAADHVRVFHAMGHRAAQRSLGITTPCKRSCPRTTGRIFSVVRACYRTESIKCVLEELHRISR